MAIEESVKKLRKELKRKTRDTFVNGDVIRWDGNSHGRTYTFAAMKTERGWYTTSTSQSFMPMVMDFDKLVEVLMRPSSTAISYAVKWELVFEEGTE